MDSYYIIAIRLGSREHNAPGFQEVLTRFGSNITVRLGLHEAGHEESSSDGVIILRAQGDKGEIDAMMQAFEKTKGVRAKLIDLN